ncbi:MAG: hypothetical protein LLG01_04300 [Planctomycetaceae bacterium]|nr:hypothetical protein [Planctomycetaceae bacterium]
MNNRDEISNDLSAYLDGELSPSRVRQIDEVLAYDKDLAGELARLKATRSLVQQLPREQAAADFVRHVLARPERTHLLPASATRAYRSMRWITYAAAAVVLITVGVAAVMTVNTGQYARLKQGPQKLGELARAPEESDRQPPRMKAAPAAPRGASKDGEIEDLKAPAPVTTLPPQPGQIKNDLHRDLARGEHGLPESSGRKKSGAGELAATPASVAPSAEARAPGAAGPEVAAKQAQPTAKGRPHDAKEVAQRAKAVNAPADAPSGKLDASRVAGGAPAAPDGPAPEPGGEQVAALEKNKGALRSGENWKGEQSIAPPDEPARQAVGQDKAAGTQAGVAAQGESLPANNVIINTASLAVAQRDIENAMVRNGVRPLVVKEQRSLGAATIGNYYLTNINNSRQVQYEAFVTADQLSRLRGELSVIRAQQDVPQVAVEPAPPAQQAQKSQQQRQDFNDRNSYDYSNAAHAADRPQTKAAEGKAPATEDTVIADAPPMPLTQAAAARPEEPKKKAATTQPAAGDAVMKQLDEIAAQEARVLNPLNQNTLNNNAREQTNLFRLVVTLNGKMAAGQAQFEDARATQRQAPASSAAQQDMYKSLNPPGKQ